MTAFVLTPAKLAEVRAATAEAQRHPIPWSFLKTRAVLTDTSTLTLEERQAAGVDEPRPKKYDSIGVEFDGGVTAAISFEEQPAGIMRHLSVSTGKPGNTKLPHPILLGVIAEAFGFRDFPAHVLRYWLEEYRPGFFAVNIVGLADPSKPPIVGHA